MIDRMEQVTDEESVEMARRLSSEEGILSGISCGAAVAAAVRIAKQDEFEGKTIVSSYPIPENATLVRYYLKGCSTNSPLGY